KFEKLFGKSRQRHGNPKAENRSSRSADREEITGFLKGLSRFLSSYGKGSEEQHVLLNLFTLHQRLLVDANRGNKRRLSVCFVF
ncbi:hypothetical protein KY382_36585, partial [Pseudomonas monteilii]|nr:hypothetical protein [Pseudomonas monteilii]